MKQEFTLAELVKKYGSKAQRQSVKKKGNLTGKEFTLLIKSVETEWESYTVEGRGSKRVITCIGKRSKKAERIDKRSNNGQGQLIGEFELNSLVVDYLIQRNNRTRPISLTKWLIELCIVDEKLTSALYGARVIHVEKLQEQFSKVINGYSKANSDIEMLDEFLQVSFKSMKSSLESVFKKLAKAKIIIHQKERWGCTTKNSHRKLNRNEIKEIASIRRILLTAHGLKGNDLFKTKKKEVKAFKEEFEKQLGERFNLKFEYDAHFCVLQDSDLGVQSYLDRLREKGDLDFTYGLTEEFAFTITNVFKNKHSERSLELAKGREKNTTNKSDSDRIKFLKIKKQYAPMWELLLMYFRCTNNIKLNSSAVAMAEATVINIEEIEFEVMNQQNLIL
ncbi:hypothetical protein [Bacillus sp. FJAT-45037]|uniref:hypothetical protein n=1 Tax=Bacillus sp. FJAT-45037 TaxID=2011007 RepID=UPI0018E20892|nr:hypothetical protein [Bacillus sp. FJAT-45037]